MMYPEGWKLVPVEPTREMMLAANKVDYEHFISQMPGHASTQAASVDAVYRAMLAAAPPPPDGVVLPKPVYCERCRSTVILPDPLPPRRR